MDLRYNVNTIAGRIFFSFIYLFIIITFCSSLFITAKDDYCTWINPHFFRICTKTTPWKNVLLPSAGDEWTQVPWWLMKHVCNPHSLIHHFSITPCQRPSELIPQNPHLYPWQSPHIDQDSQLNPHPLDSHPHPHLCSSFLIPSPLLPVIKTLSGCQLELKIKSQQMSSKSKFFSMPPLFLHVLGKTFIFNEDTDSPAALKWWLFFSLLLLPLGTGLCMCPPWYPL